MATLRRIECDERKARVSEVSRFRATLEDGSQEVAVSSVDLLLNDSNSFISQKGSHIGGNLNKAGLWSQVIDEFENTAVTKIERTNGNGFMETVYVVPVVGYMFIAAPTVYTDHVIGAYHESQVVKDECLIQKVKKSMMLKIKRNPTQFMYWQGRYYDTAMMYELHSSGRLQVVGPLEMSVPTLPGLAEGVVEFTKGISYSNSTRQRQHQLTRIVHTAQAQRHLCRSSGNAGWASSCEGDYLEINLGYPRYVTHIGTAGEYPALYCYNPHPPRPKDEYRKRRYYRDPAEVAPVLSEKGNGINQRKFSQYVQVLKHGVAALGHTSSYEVHYRNHVTHKWVLLAIASANTDALNEVILDLRPYFNQKSGLYTQHMHIRPLDHSIKPVLRVSVYGIDPGNANLKSSMSSRRNRRLDNTALQEDVCSDSETSSSFPSAISSSSSGKGEQLDTIEYAVIGTVSRDQCRYAKDGRGGCYRRYRDYDYGVDRKTLKNKVWKDTIKEAREHDYWRDS